MHRSWVRAARARAIWRRAIGQTAIQQGHGVLYRETYILLERLAEAVLDGTRKQYLQSGDAAALGAMLDRLLHHGHLLKCGPGSWRTKTAAAAG